MSEQNTAPEVVTTSSTNIFENMCPFDFEEMEVITIELGVRVWHCPVCQYIRPYKG